MGTQDPIASWVCAAKKGDASALRQLFDRFQPEVMGFCMAAARDRDLAKDLVQETFVRAFLGLAQLRDERAFAGWLYATAGNVCRTRLKQENLRQARLEVVALAYEQDSAESSQNTHRIRVVRKLLDELPAGQIKTIVQLKYGEPEHTTRQIADHLAIPHGTVTVTLMRFRSQIKRRLLALLIDEPLAQVVGGRR